MRPRKRRYGGQEIHMIVKGMGTVYIHLQTLLYGGVVSARSILTKSQIQIERLVDVKEVPSV